MRKTRPQKLQCRKKFADLPIRLFAVLIRLFAVPIRLFAVLIHLFAVPIRVFAVPNHPFDRFHHLSGALLLSELLRLQPLFVPPCLWVQVKMIGYDPSKLLVSLAGKRS